jgi:hypothetical protein
MPEQFKAGGIGVKAVGVEDLLAQEATEAEDLLDKPPEKPVYNYDSLANFILTEFEKNSRAKEDSGIEDIILDGLKAYNGEYSLEDIARITTNGGSKIFMNLTATKARAAKSWMADVFRPPNGDKPWSIEPTPMEDLPEGIKEMLQAALTKEFEESAKPTGPEGTPPGAAEAQETIRETNQKRRDIQTALSEEITAESKYQLKRMEQKIQDQLAEGGWDKALLEFLDDFVVYPTAFIKGPIINKSKRLIWQQGKPIEVDGYKFINERVDPLDIYPSPSAITCNDGNFCEHLRLTKDKIQALKGVKGYSSDAIAKVLDEVDHGIRGSWVDTGIEQDKADQEKRGSWIDTDWDIIHGIHFWGKISLEQLEEWEFYEKLENITETDPQAILDVEAILVGNNVIKCVINDDPLKRRPYYKASFMNVPGSFWGKSLPSLMSSQQRMCNAVARALSNNLGIASGPQIELYIDRLADDGDVENITPMKIWQLQSDPTGAGGRAINFWQPTSNASELLSVYNQFEEKADDVTGIPKYAYGNERTAGATQTAQGLAMLLESTSKIIKDCIRNIDDGVIKPRIEYQFYYNMQTMEDFNYTGDINIVTVGSKTLSVKGAEAARRNEFLQATANPTDMTVMGAEGRAAILREMAKDLGLPTTIVPSNYEIKQKIKKEEMAAAQQAKANQDLEMAKIESGIKATTVQIEGQKGMHQNTMQMEVAKLQLKMKENDEKLQLQIAELQRKVQKDQQETGVALKAEAGKDDRQTQEIALKLSTGKEGI